MTLLRLSGLQAFHGPSQALFGVLSITQAVSPWFYALLAVSLVCWTVARVWGRRAP